MGKASSSKKVARVARTGGGRTRRGSSTSLFWPVFVGLVVVLGTAGIVYSKEQRQPDTSRPRANAPGQVGDHWHAAIGFDVCGTFLPNISDETDPQGIHTHGDGVIHIHPGPSAAGKRATLGVYFDAVKAKVTDSEIRLPGGTVKKDGQKCGDKAASVRVKTWAGRDPGTSGKVVTGDPRDIHPGNGELITVAFLPDGADIPPPPSADELDNLSDLGAPPSTATVPPDGTSTTAPGTPDSTEAPPSSTPPPSSAPGAPPSGAPAP